MRDAFIKLHTPAAGAAAAPAGVRCVASWAACLLPCCHIPHRHTCPAQLILEPQGVGHTIYSSIAAGQGGSKANFGLCDEWSSSSSSKSKIAASACLATVKANKTL